MTSVIPPRRTPWGVEAWARRVGATRAVSAFGMLGVLLASLPVSAVTIPQALTSVSVHTNDGAAAGGDARTDSPGTTSLTRTFDAGLVFVMASAGTEGFFSTASPQPGLLADLGRASATARAASRLAGWQGAASATSQLRYFVALVQPGTSTLPPGTQVPVDITFTLALGKSSSVDVGEGFGSATGSASIQAFIHTGFGFGNFFDPEITTTTVRTETRRMTLTADTILQINLSASCTASIQLTAPTEPPEEVVCTATADPSFAIADPALAQAFALQVSPNLAPPEEVNHPPLVDAGPNQTVHEEAMVTLDGTRSSDPDGIR